MTLTKLTGFLLLAIATAACVGEPAPSTGGGNGNGNGTGGDGMSATEFFAAIGMTDCDQAFTCQATFPTDAGVTFAQAYGASASECYADAAAYYNAPAIEAAISRGTIEFDGAAAEDCLAGIAAPVCSTYWTQGPNVPAACESVIAGTVADGGSCTVDFECASFESICEGAKCVVAPQE